MKRTAERRESHERTPAGQLLRIGGAWQTAHEENQAGSARFRFEFPANSEELSLLLNRGCQQQLEEEALAWLRIQPDSLPAVESLLRACWRTGDVQGALKWVERALHLNPHEPGYRYARGLLRESVGMFHEALDDFERALESASRPNLKAEILCSIQMLESWQIHLLEILLVEDRDFRLAYKSDPDSAVKARGFALTRSGHWVLLKIAEESRVTQIFSARAGLC